MNEATRQKFEETKNRLQMKAITRNLTALSEEDQRLLVEGLKNAPVSKMMSEAQYLENIMLPKIMTNRGADSKEYKFYSGVLDSLLWAILIVDRYERLQTLHCNSQLLAEFYKEQMTLSHRELAKYDAAEDLLLTDSMNRYMQAAATRVKDKMNIK